MTARILTGMAGALMVALPLMATAADDGKRPAFKQADADGNGKISVKEATSAGVPKDEAKREDIDNDGKLTKADWKFVDMKSKSGSSSGS